MFSELDGFNQLKIKLLARDQQLTKLTIYIYTVDSSPKNWESAIKLMPGARPIKQHVSLHDFMWGWLIVTNFFQPMLIAASHFPWQHLCHVFMEYSPRLMTDFIPSGKHTKSYCENGHRNSEFSH